MKNLNLRTILKSQKLSHEPWFNIINAMDFITTLIGPSPVSGLCMHKFGRAMSLWRVRREDEVVGGEVRALHVFLCFFQASFWQEGEQ